MGPPTELIFAVSQGSIGLGETRQLELVGVTVNEPDPPAAGRLMEGGLKVASQVDAPA